jgi:trans-2,3-dihydro-3-hydroxyanthranilate isomerase
MASGLAFATLDVFTDERFKGNPLAVVLEAGGLDRASMQAIALEFNLSETVFVTAVEPAAARAAVRIFTPRAELPFAGHPTIGTALLLARDGLGERLGETLHLTLEMAAGAVPVVIDLERGAPVRATFRAPGSPMVEAPLDPALFAPAFGLDPSDLGPIAPRPAGHGLRFLLVEVASLEALARARPVAQPEALLAAGLDNGVYLFTRATGDGTIRARLFAPLHGIAEDPATGSAAAALAALLATVEPGADAGDTSWRIVQGVEMGRPSVIDITATSRSGHIAQVTVAGCAVPVTEGRLLA